MNKPKLMVFASGTKDGGGSGFCKLVQATKSGLLRAEIVAVVSNHREGGVHNHALSLGIPFIYYGGPWEAPFYRSIVSHCGAKFVALSGWLKLVKGLDPCTTFNIHPGPLPDFGGAGMYGHHVHEAVAKACANDGLQYSGVSMHFVTEKYDDGPVFFRYSVPIESTDTPDGIGARVNKVEHWFQPRITDLVIHGHIRWDGIHPESLRVPLNYKYLC